MSGRLLIITTYIILYITTLMKIINIIRIIKHINLYVCNNYKKYYTQYIMENVKK